MSLTHEVCYLKLHAVHNYQTFDDFANDIKLQVTDPLCP